MNLFALGTALVATNLPPVIVEATRLGHTATETPAYVEVITQRDIAQSGAQDIAELLQHTTPALNLLSMVSGNPAFSAVSAAGYGENGFGRFLILMDGQPLNYPDMSAPLLSQIDLGSVSQIEILHGSQCVLHGNNASAGALNIVTDPRDYASHGSIEGSAGSWNSYGIRAAYRGGEEADGTKWWASGGWSRSDGHRDHSGWQIGNLTGGLKKEWANGTYLRVSSFGNTSDYDLPGSREAPTPEDRARRHTVGINTTFNAVVNDANRLKIDVLSSAGRYRAFYASSWGDTSPVQDVYAHEITPQWICTAPISKLDHELIVGTTYRAEQSYKRLHATRHTLAAFAQDTLHLTDTVALQAGARYQRTQNENVWAGDLALLVTPLETLKTYARLSRFFRFPFVDETPLYSNDLLQPESGVQISVGGEWQLTDEFAAWTDLSVAQTQDEIFYDPTKGFGWGDNINSPDDVQRETATLGLQWARDKVANLSLGYTYTHATFDGGTFDDNRVPFTATSTLLLTGRVWLWDEFSILGGYRFLSPRTAISDFANIAPQLPSLSLFHLGVRYEPAGAEGFYLAVMIHNLFDRNYDEYRISAAYGTASYPAPRRAISLTLGYTF